MLKIKSKPLSRPTDRVIWSLACVHFSSHLLPLCLHVLATEAIKPFLQLVKFTLVSCVSTFEFCVHFISVTLPLNFTWLTPLILNSYFTSAERPSSIVPSKAIHPYYHFQSISIKFPLLFKVLISNGNHLIYSFIIFFLFFLTKI